MLIYSNIVNRESLCVEVYVYARGNLRNYSIDLYNFFTVGRYISSRWTQTVSYYTLLLNRSSRKQRDLAV